MDNPSVKKYNKAYFDKMMKPLGVVLDKEQRAAVLCNAPHSLIVAGAGAGKTTTMVAKVKYLVDSGKAKPNEILVISFTNHAVDEFKDKLHKLDGQAKWNVKTFHKLGYLLSNEREPQAWNILESNRQQDIVGETFKRLIEDKTFAEDVLLFFGTYFGQPFDDMRTDAIARYFTNNQTLRACIDGQVDKDINEHARQNKSIRYESMRSKEEVRIANWLYLHGIEYEYEKEYPHLIRQSIHPHRPYTPDFFIKQGEREAWIEHYGITEDGTSDKFTKGELEKYLKYIGLKAKWHKQFGTTLVTTYSSYIDEDMTPEHDLERKLRALGFKLYPKDPVEVCRQLVEANVNKQFEKFTGLIARFISLFKGKNYGNKKWDEWYTVFEKKQPRNALFVKIGKACYLEYEDYLKQNEYVDFEDMINNTCKVLSERHVGRKRYKYVLIDEYQDISRNRLDFAKKLSEYCSASVTAVGDDWQTIFGYAGADDELFRQFEEDFPGAKRLLIRNTYRNSQQLIDTAGRFVMKDKSLYRKQLKSEKDCLKPIYIHAYDEYGSDGNMPKNEALVAEVAILLERLRKENPNADWSKEKILLLGRFGFDGKEVMTLLKEVETIQGMQLDFLTVHKAKGATYDHVIILNGRDDVFGFPSKVMTEPIINLVIDARPKEIEAEERRLFYVALTRTKNKVYVLTPKKRPSRFVVELMKNSKRNVEANVDHLKTQDMSYHECPYCNSPLQYRQSRIRRYFVHGGFKPLDVWMCTNDPEACGFITNDLKGGEMAIEQCLKCNTGYLIIKRNHDTDERFLACTNYKAPSINCECKISYDNYMNRYFMSDDCFIGGLPY